MINQDIQTLQNLIRNSQKSNNKLLNYTKKYNYIYAPGKLNWDESNSEILKYLGESKIIIIKQCSRQNQSQEYQYYVLSFEHTIIVFDNLSKECLDELLKINSELSFLFLTDPKEIINETERKKFNEIHPHDKFEDEINKLTEKLTLRIPTKSINSLYTNIKICIASYLIQKSYQKSHKNRTDSFNSKLKQSETFSEISEKDYIELRTIGIGAAFIVDLVYHIDREELFVVKKVKDFEDKEKEKLIKRVCSNCLKLHHQYLPEFYGKVKNKDYHVMEFINGESLDSIDIKKYNDNDI